MQDKIFYPKYMIRHSWDVLSISLFLATVLIFSFLKLGPYLFNLLGLGYLIFFLVLFSRLYIRRIVFADSYFIVEKYIWHSLQVDYSDIIDMGASKLKTRRGEISFAAMSNVRELQSLLFELMRQGKIDIEQFENKALNEEVALHKSFLPTAILSAILSGVFLLYWFYHQSDFPKFSTWLVPALIVLIVFYGVYWVNKTRIKIQ